jgi:hypothetical protein
VDESSSENGDMIQFRWRESTHMISSGTVQADGPHRHDGPYHAVPAPPVLEYRLHFMPSVFQPMGSRECIVLKEIPEDMKRWVEVPTS